MKVRKTTFSREEKNTNRQAEKKKGVGGYMVYWRIGKEGRKHR